MKKIIFVFSIVLLATLVASSVEASHSWGPYHWARTSNPFSLELGDNLTSNWDPFLVVASDDWSVPSVLDTVVAEGRALRHKSPQRDCGPNAGRVEVCNKTYGNNGWLGIAQIWVNGSHITQGATKMNDTYFNMSTYNTPAWRQFVICQEIGHTFGLDHQDENFNNANLGTCMDYTNNPSTNQHPNQHDYDQLVTIYSHLDSTTTISQTINGGGKGKPANVGQDIDLNDPSAWGRAVKQDASGKDSIFERDLGKGNKIFTFVIWAE